MHYGKRQSVLLTGYRATGKTFVGKMLAARLGCLFVDADEVIAERENAQIAELVAEHGWKAFRRLEQSFLAEMAEPSPKVLAVGGGAIEHGTVWQALKPFYLVVWLQADVHTIMERMAGDQKTAQQRPALTAHGLEQEIVEVLNRRIPLYAKGSDLVLDTAAYTPAELVDSICNQMNQR
ncbi:MAG: shikimate kinase [Desulfobulbus propionicus]|nr:MAG: shikimate kinase [Desulfobulbus propionicus]PIE64007.1 MAG: shikimate kinase [Desulfobacterales bacterium]